MNENACQVRGLEGLMLLRYQFHAKQSKDLIQPLLKSQWIFLQNRKIHSKTHIKFSRYPQIDKTVMEKRKELKSHTFFFQNLLQSTVIKIVW